MTNPLPFAAADLAAFLPVIGTGLVTRQEEKEEDLLCCNAEGSSSGRRSLVKSTLRVKYRVFGCRSLKLEVKKVRFKQNMHI